MTMQLVQSNRRHRVVALAAALLLSILPAFAGIAAAQTRAISPVATAHPLLRDDVPGTRDKNSVQVRATHGQPVLAFDATDLDFGTAALGDSSGWQMTVLTNTGTVDATALEFSADPEFPFPPIPGAEPCYGWTVLPPDGTCLVAVKFAPVSSGPAIGTLRVSSAEGAEASLDLSGIGSEESVLYGQFPDWTMQPWFMGMLNSHFVSNRTKNSDLADDFQVEAGRDWIVSAVGAEVLDPELLHPPQTLAYIAFVPDVDGVPGDVPVCAAPDSQITLWETPFDENRAVIQLSSPCTLAPGHYWLRIVLNVETWDDKLYWGVQFVLNPDDSPGVHLHLPVWRNPEGGIGVPDCTDWTPVVPPSCDLAIAGPTVYGSVFWIIGQEIVVDPIFADGFDVE